MSIYGNVPTATATVGANTNAVAIVGLDLTIVSPGMTINFGARDGKEGKAYLIASVAATGTSGGSLTLVGTVPSPGFSNAPFLIDTTGYLSTDLTYVARLSLQLLDTLNRLFSPSTNLFAGARQLILDKTASTALSRFGFSTANRAWADIAHRAFAFTPTGGQTTSIETLAVRALSDGVTPIDALLFDLSNGTGDLRKGSATMASGATVDLSSAPTGKVAITGAATIASFGPGKHLERLVHFVDGGGTLTHNATSLILPGGASIATRAGDCLHATSDGSGNWRVHAYARGDGTPLILPPSTQRAGFRNRVINGNFGINQRGVSFASTTYAAGAYILDRWKAGPSGVTMSWTGFGNGDVLVAITAGSLLQVIEGGLYLQEGGTFTLSWTGTATARIYQGAASGAFAPGPVSANLPQGANATIEFGTGTVSFVQFEPGSVVTAFERRDDEVRRCQRYFCKSYALATAPGASTNSGLLGHLLEAAAPVPSQFIQLPNEMRATPAVITYSQTGVSGKINLDAGEYNSVVAFACPRSFLAYTTTVGAAGQTVAVHYTASAEL